MHKDDNLEAISDCDRRYDFAIFSFKRLMCTLNFSFALAINLIIYLSTFLFVAFILLNFIWPGKGNSGFDVFVSGDIIYVGLVSISISIFISLLACIGHYVDLNCSNNPNCRYRQEWTENSGTTEYLYEGGEWKGRNERYFKVKWFEHSNATKEKYDN